MSEQPVRAQLGHPAEAEVPDHQGEPGRPGGDAVEDTAAFELAVEDGRPLPPDELPVPPPADAAVAVGPEFRAPGA